MCNRGLAYHRLGQYEVKYLLFCIYLFVYNLIIPSLGGLEGL
jgi:hypothetical protein